MSQLKPTLLLDLHDHHCLERVLAYLNLEDLLNVAHTSQQMRAAAELTLRDKFKRHSHLYLIFIKECSIEFKVTTSMPHYAIELWDLRFLLRFIRCFGASIAELRLGYNVPYHIIYMYRDNKLFRKIMPFLCEHASEYLNVSLKKMHIRWPGLDNVDNFASVQKQFTNVEELHVEYWNGP